LLHAAQFGVLADPNAGGLPEAVVLDLIAAHKDHPDLASAALDAAPDAEHPEVLARGVATLGPLEASGFKQSNRTYYSNPEYVKNLSRNGLKMGGMTGGTSFADLQPYYAADKHATVDPLHPTGPGATLTKKGTAYASALGRNLVTSQGTVDFNSPAAKATLDN